MLESVFRLRNRTSCRDGLNSRLKQVFKLGAAFLGRAPSAVEVSSCFKIDCGTCPVARNPYASCAFSGHLAPQCGASVELSRRRIRASTFVQSSDSVRRYQRHYPKEKKNIPLQRMCFHALSTKPHGPGGDFCQKAVPAERVALHP